MSLIAIYSTNRNELGYRTIPLSFEYSWKVGDKIKTEDGTEICTIEVITSGTKKTLEYLRNQLSNKKTFQTPRLVINDKQKSFGEQIKLLKSDANTTRGKQLMYRYQCSIDDLCFENIKECFTKIHTSGRSYFCRIIKRTDENEMTEDDLNKIIPSDYFIYGPIVALFEREYKYDINSNGFGFIKNNIEYTLQLVHSFSLESILKRLRMYKGERAKQALIELHKIKSDNELKQKIKQVDIAKKKAKKAVLLATEKRLEKLEKEKVSIAKRNEMFKEKDSEIENIGNITKRKRRKRISE